MSSAARGQAALGAAGLLLAEGEKQSAEAKPLEHCGRRPGAWQPVVEPDPDFRGGWHASPRDSRPVGSEQLDFSPDPP